MNDEIVALARHRLERAYKTFGERELLQREKSLIGAVNRFYYAAFYAARALLATVQLDSSKHSGVISLFQKNFVKTGNLEPEIAKALPRAFEKRQKTDYGDFATIQAGECESIREQVRLFVDKCAEILYSRA